MKGGSGVINIKNVSFGYKENEENLSDISLRINDGECVLLCGESGCGKTTVTKLINGLIPHFEESCSLKGSVTAENLKVADTELYELAKHVGSVFQNPKSQFFNLDTDSELSFGLENEGAAPQHIDQRVSRTAEALCLDKILHRNIFSLSGGEKQTLAFASVYAMDPSIYVLDEPTANLDEKAIERLRQQILHLKSEGHTVVIAEHRLYFLADIIDRALYIKDGRLARSFTGAEFRSLTEQERIAMGLRSIRPAVLHLPPASLQAQKEGLRVEQLCCGYKKEGLIFENLSFSALPGEVTAITGHNGSGKTTLMRCLCGLLKERSGKVFLNGKVLNRKGRQREAFCVMQDVNHQLFYDSVWNECEQVSGAEPAEIGQVLDGFNLLSLKQRHPMALSGGQKQRLAVATALLSGKRLLIFDEPTSGLDYGHMQEVCRVVRSLASQGHIVLVVSHDTEFMKNACDRVLAMEGVI